MLFRCRRRGTPACAQPPVRSDWSLSAVAVAAAAGIAAAGAASAQQAAVAGSATAGDQPAPSIGAVDPLPPAPASVTLPAEQHAWARFELGAWRTLRTVTETYDEAGKFLLRSETLHTDKLVEVTDDTYTVETSSIVEVGGKRLRGAAKLREHSLLSAYSNQPPLVTRLAPADIDLGTRTIPCQRWELAIGKASGRQLETVYYSPEFPPYVFRRELSAADGSNSAQLTTATETILAAELPILIDGAMVSGHQVQVRTTAGANTTESIEVRTLSVPGGLITAANTERGPSGRRIRWMVTELEEFGQAGERPKNRRAWRILQRRGN